jgi:hypothetical protein
VWNFITKEMAEIQDYEHPGYGDDYIAITHVMDINNISTLYNLDYEIDVFGQEIWYSNGDAKIESYVNSYYGDIIRTEYLHVKSVLLHSKNDSFNPCILYSETDLDLYSSQFPNVYELGNKKHYLLNENNEIKDINGYWTNGFLFQPYEK